MLLNQSVCWSYCLQTTVTQAISQSVRPEASGMYTSTYSPYYSPYYSPHYSERCCIWQSRSVATSAWQPMVMRPLMQCQVLATSTQSSLITSFQAINSINQSLVYVRDGASLPQCVKNCSTFGMRLQPASDNSQAFVPALDAHTGTFK